MTGDHKYQFDAKTGRLTVLVTIDLADEAEQILAKTGQDLRSYVIDRFCAYTQTAANAMRRGPEAIQAELAAKQDEVAALLAAQGTAADLSGVEAAVKPAPEPTPDAPA